MAKENHDPMDTTVNPQKSSQKQPNVSPEMSNINNATDLFELLERCQSQRLDDQRCVLPSYFSQVSRHILYTVRTKEERRFSE